MGEGMERLKFILIGLVAVLAIAVAYGVVRGGDDGGEGATTAADARPEAAPEAESVPPPEASPEAAPGKQKAQAPVASGGANKAQGKAKPAKADKPAGAGEESADQGPGSKASAGGDGPSRKVVIRKGNLICAQVPSAMAREVHKLESQKAGAAGGEAQMAVLYLRAAKPVLLRAARKFSALPVPSGDEDRIAAMVDSLETTAREASKASLEELTTTAEPLAEFRRLASAYGFAACGKL